MLTLPTLDQIPHLGFDTETTGLGFKDIPVGASFSLPDGHKFYARWGHPEGNNISLSRFRDWANRELARPGLKLVAHEALFDLRMLAGVSVDVEKILRNAEVHDTGYMAAIHNELEPAFNLGFLGKKHLGRSKSDEQLNRVSADRFGGRATRKAQAGNYWRLPGDVVEEYAEDDAEITRCLFEHFGRCLTREGLVPVYTRERRLIPLLYRMYMHGVRVDVDTARREHARIQAEFDRMLEEWNRVTGGVPLSGTGSRKALHDLWRRIGGDFGTTKNGNPSLDKHVLAATDHPVARLLNGLRRREKVLVTFLQGYILDNEVDGYIHGSFHPLRTEREGASKGTVSGRFSSSDPNLQNLFSPDRDDTTLPENEWYGHILRRIFLPWTPDHRWVKADYSQIEFRAFAHYAGGNVAARFTEDPDVDFHQMCADIASERSGKKVPRTTAKNGNFAVLFGAGVPRLAETLGISQQAAQEFLDLYLGALPEARELKALAVRGASKRGFIRTHGGRLRRFEKSKRGKYLRTHMALNALCQGSAADWIKDAMLGVAEELDWQDNILHLTVHDELDLSVHKGAKGATFIRRVKDIMEGVAELRVPILADIEVGPTWADVKDWNVNSKVLR